MVSCIGEVAEGLKCCSELQTLNIENNEMWYEETLVLIKGLRSLKY